MEDRLKTRYQAKNIEIKLLSRKSNSLPVNQAPFPQISLLSRKTGSYPVNQAPIPEEEAKRRIWLVCRTRFCSPGHFGPRLSKFLQAFWPSSRHPKKTDAAAPVRGEERGEALRPFYDGRCLGNPGRAYWSKIVWRKQIPGRRTTIPRRITRCPNFSLSRSSPKVSR